MLDKAVADMPHWFMRGINMSREITAPRQFNPAIQEIYDIFADRAKALKQPYDNLRTNYKRGCEGLQPLKPARGTRLYAAWAAGHDYRRAQLKDK
jgi:hypothetical protein